jgi:virginiamycin B lyase
LKKSPHVLINDQIDSEPLFNSNLHLVDVPLNFTLLEHQSNKTNYSNTTRSSNVNQDFSNSTIAREEEFRRGFCGINSTTSAYSGYDTEYLLPQSCEMPLGIVVDDEDGQVWYVSTKRGILGTYDNTENKFRQYRIPQWYVRENPRGYSQVWDMKIDDDGDGSDEIWFTDTAQNAIWRFTEATEQFEIYRIPGRSESFGTTYPITLNIFTSENGNKDSGGNGEGDSDNNDHKSIFFIGTFVPSLWYAEINDLKNGTSDGIHEVKLPIEHEFRDIDPFYVTSGSFDIDEGSNSIWISMLSYSRKGQIMEYDLDSKSFKIFGLPQDLNSPLGIVVGENKYDNDDNYGDSDTPTDLWIANPGTSIFYNYK